jgi:hypothetical protein
MFDDENILKIYNFKLKSLDIFITFRIQKVL